MKRISNEDKRTVAEVAAQRAIEEIREGRKANRVECLKAGFRIARPDVLVDGGFDLSQEQYNEVNRRFEEALKVRIINEGLAK